MEVRKLSCILGPQVGILLNFYQYGVLIDVKTFHNSLANNLVISSFTDCILNHDFLINRLFSHC